MDYNVENIDTQLIRRVIAMGTEIDAKRSFLNIDVQDFVKMAKMGRSTYYVRMERENWTIHEILRCYQVFAYVEFKRQNER